MYNKYIFFKKKTTKTKKPKTTKTKKNKKTTRKQQKPKKKIWMKMNLYLRRLLWLAWFFVDARSGFCGNVALVTSPHRTSQSFFDDSEKIEKKKKKKKEEQGKNRKSQLHNKNK